MPPQSCVPDGHTPEQAAAASMHVPAHGFIVPGHFGMHMVPSHVADPPVGGVQALHDVVPQLPGSMLLTQRLPHR